MGLAARPIAVVEGTDSEGIQALLAATATGWRTGSARIAGVTAEAHGRPERPCSAGVLRDIATGERFSIHLETTPEGTTCHLDAAGVEAACAHLIGQIAGSDLVILSKFGKLEAMGQGLFPAFEAARAAGKPLLTTVSEKHRDAWEAFAPEAAHLEADPAALAAWWSRLPEQP